jgi:hypothetical protein
MGRGGVSGEQVSTLHLHVGGQRAAFRFERVGRSGGRIGASGWVGYFGICFSLDTVCGILRLALRTPEAATLERSHMPHKFARMLEYWLWWKNIVGLWLRLLKFGYYLNNY